MRFKSDYTAEELALIVRERAEQYSFYNLHLPDTVLASCKKNRLTIWKTKRADSFCATKLTNAFYGKIFVKDGKTVIKGYFRLANSDLVSWLVVFVLYLAVVFAATAGTVAERLFNMGIMGIIWCGICTAAILVENICDRAQKKAVIEFIRENLLTRDISKYEREDRKEWERQSI